MFRVRFGRDLTRRAYRTREAAQAAANDLFLYFSFNTVQGPACLIRPDQFQVVEYSKEARGYVATTR